MSGELKDLLSDFGGYVLTCRRCNTDEWMQGLAERLTIVAKALGDNDVYKYSEYSRDIIRIAGEKGGAQ